MTQLRTHWEGLSIAGNYTLEMWLGGDESAAFFQTSLDPEGRRAVVKLVPEAAGDGAATLDLWHRTRHLRHPNLIELLDCGRVECGGESFCYAVFEAPDETLAAALSRGGLNTQESREVLDAVIDALRYLHAQGMVAGALDPEHIVAVGDRIKLSTAALRDAETSSAYREDVRLLGELWHQALMAASPRSEEIAEHAADPNAQTRWTLAEIHVALSPPRAPLPAPGTPIADARPEPPPLPPSRPHIPVPAPPFRFPRWILAGTAGFLLLILALNRPRHVDVATEAPVLSVPVNVPAPVAAPKPSPVDPREMWRVIAFTYRSRDAAEKKAQRLNGDHPGLNAGVFSPKGQKGYYLVSLGGRMTREDAVRLQHSARGKGLPRDLYVQNYSE